MRRIRAAHGAGASIASPEREPFQFYDYSAREWVLIGPAGTETGRKSPPRFDGVRTRRKDEL
jgi:hypothetical protein